MVQKLNKDGVEVVATNRRARHQFSILDTVEAGIVLVGSEVKTLRLGVVQLSDSYARIVGDECWLYGVHIAPYSNAHGFGAHVPDRSRKLLLHRPQIDKWNARANQEQLTIVPLSLYFKDGRAKVELGLCKGRRTEDRRQAIAERDSKRDTARELGRKVKGNYGA